MDNLFFNFFALGALLPSAFMFFFAGFFIMIKNKSQATKNLAAGYSVLTFFFFAYFITALIYEPWAAYHRWVTVPTVLAGIVQIIIIGLTYHKSVNKRFVKIVMVTGYVMAAVLTILFYIESLKSDIIYHFDGHYYDFNEEKISKLIGAAILLWFVFSIVVGIVRFIKTKGPERWPILLIAFFLVAGPLIPAYFNILSRSGLVSREIYQISQDISTIISYFIVVIVFIDSTKEKTPFLTKIMGVSLSVLFLIFQGFLYESMQQQEKAFDQYYYERAKDISMLPEEDTTFAYIKEFDLQTQTSTYTHSKYKEELLPQINNNQEYINTVIYEQIFGPNSRLVTEISFENVYFAGHKALLGELTQETDNKQTIAERMKEKARFINFHKLEIEKLPAKDFKQSLSEYLPKLKVEAFKEPLSNYLDTTTLAGEALKEATLNFFTPFHSENVRIYRRSPDDRTHYVAYLYTNIRGNQVYEIAFPYTLYRQTIHDNSSFFAFLILSMVIIVMFGYPIFFKNSLLKPIKSLLKGLRDLNNGKLSTTIPIRVEDEFGIMAHSFNEMASTLHDMTENLEHKVKERTLEIEMQKEEIKAQADMLMHTNLELEKLSVVASETDNAVAIFDDNKQLEWVNQGFTRLYGYTLDEFIEQFGSDLFRVTRTHEIEKIIQSCITKKESVVYEARNETKTGDFLWVQTTLTPIFDDDENVKKFIAIDTNITSQKEAEIEIMQRNEEITSQKELLEERNKFIEHQKKIVEDKNKHINSSLKYARTIQQAILPSKAQLNKYFDSFIIFRPRDIVSGDFYWFSEYYAKEKHCLFFAAVDCTGHGVPGAFMSLIGSRMLNTIVNEKQIINPADILEEMNTRIRKALNQDESQNTDGMDVCLMKVTCGQQSKRKMSFAGAKRPLYIYNRDTETLTTIKGTRRTIGGVKPRENIPFESHEIEISTNDIVYLSSDGFIDQNNSERKRYGSLRLERKIQQISHLPLHQQQQELEQDLDNYQQNEVQRDDITLIGVRLKN